MKQKTKKGRAILLQILFFGVLVLMLLFPMLWAQAKDAAWDHRSVTRPTSPGILTEEARSIPVLYTLHSAAQSRNKMELLQPGKTQQEIVPILNEMLEQLTQADVLTQADLTHLQTMLEQPTPNLEIEENRFYTAYRLDWWKKQTHLGQIWILFSTEDRRVVEIFVSTEQTDAPEEILQAYSKYLGVDALQNWSVQETDTENTVKWHSQIGQATLFCSLQKGQLHLSITADDTPYNHF